jgi:hypothetical protein
LLDEYTEYQLLPSFPPQYNPSALPPPCPFVAGNIDVSSVVLIVIQRVSDPTMGTGDDNVNVFHAQLIDDEKL